MFQTADGIIDLSLSGKAAKTPLDARNQPARYPKFRYSKHETRYRFDPETYKGLDSLEPLLKDVSTVQFERSKILEQPVGQSIQLLHTGTHLLFSRGEFPQNCLQRQYLHETWNQI